MELYTGTVALSVGTCVSSHAGHLCRVLQIAATPDRDRLGVDAASAPGIGTRRYRCLRPRRAEAGRAAIRRPELSPLRRREDVLVSARDPELANAVHTRRRLAHPPGRRVVVTARR